MQIIKRTENPLLDRVELKFEWNHANQPTPTLAEMVTAAAKAEPGSKKENIFVKDVNTRYGRPLTTGIALVYGSAESAANELEYVKERHKEIHAPAAPAAEEAASEGGDE